MKKPEKPIKPRDPGSLETSDSTSDRVKTLMREHRALIDAGESPLSDRTFPFRDDFTREDCINLLRVVAEMYPSKVLSRNFFKNNSGISESTWNRYFGTFEEFKRQARIKLSRHVHRHERSLAKHASVDHYRAMNNERALYEGKYEKDHGNRFITLLVGADFHDREVDPFALRVWVEAVRRIQPETIVFGGDIFDLPEFGCYAVDPREWDVVGRIRSAHNNILIPTRNAAPNANIHLIEGNHENRLMRHLADGSPSMRSVLSDLHGMTVSSLLKLDELQINYTARANLAAWTQRDIKSELRRNYRFFYDCFLVHHFKDGMKKGVPGCHGHSHKHVVWPFESPVFGPYEWHQLGCMHYRSAVYTDAERWSVGFGVVHIDTQTKSVNWEYINVTDQAVLGGVRYVRKPEETLHGASTQTT